MTYQTLTSQKLRLADQTGQIRDLEIPPGGVVIGRAAAADIVIADSRVSSRHARLDVTADTLVVSDLGSTNGTYVNGRRVAGPTRLTTADVLRVGRTSLRPIAEIGSATTDQPAASLRATPPPPAASKPAPWYRKTAALVAAVLILAMAVGGPATATYRASASQTPKPVSALSPAGITKLERSVVLITTYLNGSEQGIGSGTIIRSSGLILTNAHVGAPNAPGLYLSEGEQGTAGADYTFKISIVTNPNQPAVASYWAKTAAADGYLDAALLQITSTVGGAAVSPGSLHLPAVPIGDSSKLRAGDRVGVLGFPGIGGGFNGSIDYEPGQVSGYTADDMNKIGPQAWLKTSAKIAPGNSGGLGVNSAGQIIGIPTQNISQSQVNPEQPQDVSEGRMRPIDLVKPLTRAAENGTVSTYQDPYLVMGSGQEQGQMIGWSSEQPDANCQAADMQAGQYGSFAPGAKSIYASIGLSGMTNGEDVTIVWDYTPNANTTPTMITATPLHGTWKTADGSCWGSQLPVAQPTTGYYVYHFLAGPSGTQLASGVITVGTPASS